MNIAYAKMKEISISDVLGHVVLSRVLSGVNTLQLDVSHLPKGFYMLKVTGTNGVVETQKLIVE